MTWIVKRLLTKDINISVPNDILNYLPEDIVINSKIKGDLHIFLIDDINVRVSCLITEKKVQISKNVLFFKKTRQMYTYRVYLMISDNSYRT